MTQPLGGDAIADMFTAHAPALALYARQWVGADEAEDVVQRVFARLVAAGRLPEDARTWLFRCVRNEAISAGRSARRRGRRERAAGPATNWFIPRAGDRIDAAAAQVALADLPPVQREVVTLRIWSGLTLAQTAAVTGLAVSSVHHHYRTALTALRERLEVPCTNPK